MGDLSVKNMFLHADPVVQGVMILLLLASLACWVVIFEKIALLWRAGREIRDFKQKAVGLTEALSFRDWPEWARRVAEAGLAESRDGAGGETRADFRERVERSMRATLAERLAGLETRVLFLATVGASSPFIGLFGTVWGIMHSFVGIAAAGETSLAVVAPGIAEALLATAMGLVAAIPAVIAFNKISNSTKMITREALGGIGLLGNHLARLHFQREANPADGARD